MDDTEVEQAAIAARPVSVWDAAQRRNGTVRAHAGVAEPPRLNAQDAGSLRAGGGLHPTSRCVIEAGGRNSPTPDVRNSDL
ncbi:hypothetical protein [Microbispora siamensis]|uniref:Uncharacterized protein n=1 Tax=Microbispora siamensis TaxID=564413 RepID=A0ABQ4GNI2_9ACTN|nr:hypothetical protein [Microbispora siamensis]GIH62943.1 hypothetical protein Msi02_37600 [Microbispora siamensis]